MWILGAIRGAVDTATASFRRWCNDAEGFRSFNDVPVEVLRVLQLVYMLLSFAFTSSAFGYFFRQNGIIGNSSAAIGLIATIAWLVFAVPQSEGIRVLCFIVGAFFGGAFLCPHIVEFLGIIPGSLATSLVGISLGFRIFWGATVWAKHIDIWYYSGVYLSAPIIMLWTMASSIEFGGISPLLMPETYMVTMSFLMYVTGYSTVLVRRIEQGDKDYVRHAMYLITGFPDVILQCAGTLMTIVLPILFRIVFVAYWLYLQVF